jgi:hypothetical protein
MKTRRARLADVEKDFDYQSGFDGRTAFGLVDVIWSNANCMPYHVACAHLAPAPTVTDLVDGALTCGGCGKAVGHVG